MLIIVEGPPGAGKTSLTSRLRVALAHQHGKENVSTLHGFKGISFKTGGDSYLHSYISRLEDYVPGDGKHLICDGWHWGMPALKLAHTQTQSLPAYLIRYVNLKIAQLGGVIVHLNPSVATLEARMGHTNPYSRWTDKMVTALPQVRSAMVSYMHESDATVLASVSSMRTIVETATHLESKAAELNAWSSTAWPMYLGPPNPATVLVDLEPEQYEVLYPTAHTGNRYLQRVLHSLPVEQRESIGMLNVAHVTSEAFVNLVRTLGMPRLVALGRKSSDFLGQVAHSTVLNHRQARRSNVPPADYADLLVRATTLPVGTDLTERRLP